MSAMTFDTTRRKVLLGYYNQVTNNTVTITTSNITGFVSGYGTDNLKNDDPHMPVKTNGVTGAPEIMFDFTPSTKEVRLVSVYNHNLKTQGYSSISLHYWSSSWQLAGTWNIMSNDAVSVALFGGNDYEDYKITFNGASADFTVGGIYLGLVKALTTNPSADGFVQTISPNIRVIQSGGNAKHVISGAGNGLTELNMDFEFQDRSDADFFRGLSTGQFLGVVPPEYSDSPHLGPIGQPFFWGYITEMEMASWEIGSIANSTNRYTCGIRMEGGL